MFECFNTANVKKADNENGYSSSGVRMNAKSGLGWMMGTVITIGFLGAILGAV